MRGEPDPRLVPVVDRIRTSRFDDPWNKEDNDFVMMVARRWYDGSRCLGAWGRSNAFQRLSRYVSEACYFGMFSSSASGLVLALYVVHLGVTRGIDRRVQTQVVVSHPSGHNVRSIRTGAGTSLPEKRLKARQVQR